MVYIIFHDNNKHNYHEQVGSRPRLSPARGRLLWEGGAQGLHELRHPPMCCRDGVESLRQCARSTKERLMERDFVAVGRKQAIICHLNPWS